MSGGTVNVARPKSTAGLPLGAVSLTSRATVAKSFTVKLVDGTVPDALTVSATGASVETTGPTRLVSPRICAAAVGSKFEPVTATTVPGTPDAGDRVTARVPEDGEARRHHVGALRDDDRPGPAVAPAGTVIVPLKVPEALVASVLAAVAPPTVTVKPALGIEAFHQAARDGEHVAGAAVGGDTGPLAGDRRDGHRGVRDDGNRDEPLGGGAVAQPTVGVETPADRAAHRGDGAGEGGAGGGPRDHLARQRACRP